MIKWKKSALGFEYTHFTRMYQELLIILGFQQLEPDDPNHMVIMANLGRFGTILSDYESANMLGGRARKWERDLKGLFWYMTLYATSSYEEQAGDDIGGADAVQLMTIHQAKGLEWPIVFIPSVVKKRFPTSMIGREGKWLIPRELFKASKYESDIDSERKLFYVALTRAKETLIVSYFKKLTNKVSPSEFISEGLDLSRMIKINAAKSLPLCKVEKVIDIEDLQTFAASDSVISKEEMALQVQLYTTGLKMVGEPVTKGSVAFLENASTETVNVDGVTLKSAQTKAESYIDGIMNRNFSACPGNFCGQCPYKLICRYKK